MKKAHNLPKIFTSVVLFFAGLSQIIAQETSKLDVNVDLGGNAKSGVWYTQTWIWVVIGLVFILLLVALLRGGNSDKAA